MKTNYVYIVLCSDSTYYTGWTTNIIARLDTHNKGKGAKYTKARCPVELVYLEALTDKSLALKREYAIKQLNRKQKEALIDEHKLATAKLFLAIMSESDILKNRKKAKE